MKKIIKNISVYLLSSLVIFLSIGMNISKMKCGEEGKFYLGTGAPSCFIDTEVICVFEKEKIACCKNERVESCCPEINTESCASETEKIHFDFETLVSKRFLSFTEIAIDLLVSHSVLNFRCNHAFNNFQIRIPIPKAKYSIFSKIQSFLL